MITLSGDRVLAKFERTARRNDRLRLLVSRIDQKRSAIAAELTKELLLTFARKIRTAVLVHNCELGDADDLIHVPQKGNGPVGIANGLNRSTRGSRRSRLRRTEDAAQTWADKLVGTHENYYFKFTLKAFRA
ncbi:hypothetical protein [Amycolatopsis sp. NPDC051372]|uniref:hypothetical protein n=1 Tax=Amycolatopsis sp. NPDC051372 TaxID=3155669 RepID=UPI003433C370